MAGGGSSNPHARGLLETSPGAIAVIIVFFLVVSLLEWCSAWLLQEEISRSRPATACCCCCCQFVLQLPVCMGPFAQHNPRSSQFTYFNMLQKTSGNCIQCLRPAGHAGL